MKNQLLIYGMLVVLRKISSMKTQLLIYENFIITRQKVDYYYVQTDVTLWKVSYYSMKTQLPFMKGQPLLYEKLFVALLKPTSLFPFVLVSTKRLAIYINVTKYQTTFKTVEQTTTNIGVHVFLERNGYYFLPVKPNICIQLEFHLKSLQFLVKLMSGTVI